MCCGRRACRKNCGICSRSRRAQLEAGGGGFCRRHKGRIDPSPRTYVQAVFQSLEEDPTVYMTMTMLGHSRVLLSPYAYHCNVSSPLSRTFQAWSVPI